MEQSRLKRHAALAIVMVGVATALVAMGRILAQGGNPEEAQNDEQDSWFHFSSRCASDRLKTLPPPEPESMALDPEKAGAGEAPKPLAAADADYRGCGGGDWVTDFWTANVEGLYTTAVPLVEIPLEQSGEEPR